MDRLLYVAMSGAKEAMLAQAVNANNLANANTTGFRADLQASRSLGVTGPGYDARAYAITAEGGIDAQPGALITTGRALDVAVSGDGWIAVQAPDGSEAYTRAGNLKVDSNGLMTTGAGHPVMGNAGPIAVPPFSKIAIGNDGTISIRPLGQGPETLATVDRIKLVDPDPASLRKSDDGLVHVVGNRPEPPDAGIHLVSGTLESSNVNSVEAMVDMIQLARRFEMQVNMMKTAQDNDRAATQLLRLG